MLLKSTFLAFKKVVQVVQIGGRGRGGRVNLDKFEFEQQLFFGKPSLKSRQTIQASVLTPSKTKSCPFGREKVQQTIQASIFTPQCPNTRTTFQKGASSRSYRPKDSQVHYPSVLLLLPHRTTDHWKPATWGRKPTFPKKKITKDFVLAKLSDLI